MSESTESDFMHSHTYNHNGHVESLPRLAEVFGAIFTDCMLFLTKTVSKCSSAYHWGPIFEKS